MNQWQQSFAKRVEVLRESAVAKFERFAEDVVSGVYEEYAAFTGKYEFRPSAPPPQRGVRFYKFSLSEDAYVLLFFRARGLDAVECDYECSSPGHGCSNGEKVSAAVAEAGRGWVERRFQTALDDLVGQVSEGCVNETVSELVGA
jgi:hypothetical protein